MRADASLAVNLDCLVYWELVFGVLGFHGQPWAFRLFCICLQGFDSLTCKW